MSSFFTLPTSQRKRKREDASDAKVSKKRAIAAHHTDKDDRASRKSKLKRDESISSCSSENHEQGNRAIDEVVSGSESESEDETGAERRLRLAEQYLQNLKGDVDEVGFDAEKIDRDLIAERLQEDVVCIPPTWRTFSYILTPHQGRNEGTHLSAYSSRSCIPRCCQDPVPLGYRYYNGDCSMPSLRLHCLERYHPVQVGAFYA